MLILASDEHAAALSAALVVRSVRVQDRAELVSHATKERPAAVFVDCDRLPELEGELAGVPIVAVVDTPPAETLSKIVHVLASHTAVAHVLAAALLASPVGRSQLNSLVERLGGGPEHDLLGTASVGRIAMLAQASRRQARFDRIEQYFSKHGVSSRTISAIYEVAEELVMNALYNAPAEAGHFKTPVSRTEDVTLPADRACEISYGLEEGTPFVRVRDTFGALHHDRLLEVLTRCNTSDVAIDESRGGAGLGLWRVFSMATTITITVIPGRLTDMLVRIEPRRGKRPKQLLRVDLYFLPDSQKVADALATDEDSSLFDHSVTMLQN